MLKLFMFLLLVEQKLAKKSHLIKAIKYEATRLSQIALHPDDTCVVLTAPRGITAYNFQTATIHNTFFIRTYVKFPYTPLGEEKLNSFRGKLQWPSDFNYR